MSERRGRVEGVDSDGDRVVYGWGPNFMCSGVEWTHELFCNSNAHIKETKAEAVAALSETFVDQAHDVEVLIKHLKRAANQLRQGAAAVARGERSPVSYLLAKHRAEEAAQAEVDKERRVRQAKAALQAARSA